MSISTYLYFFFLIVCKIHFIFVLQKILYRSVFPMLREQLVNQDMLVLVLPALISLVEHCSEEDYKTLVQPEVKRVLTMSSGRPVQVSQNFHY